MICVYHKRHTDALQTSNDRPLSCKATWVESNAINLRTAIGAIAHAPRVWASEGEIQVEVDGVMFAVDQLPPYGPDLVRRCSYWLDNRRRSQARSPSPVFGL